MGYNRPIYYRIVANQFNLNSRLLRKPDLRIFCTLFYN